MSCSAPCLNPQISSSISTLHYHKSPVMHGAICTKDLNLSFLGSQRVATCTIDNLYFDRRPFIVHAHLMRKDCNFYKNEWHGSFYSGFTLTLRVLNPKTHTDLWLFCVSFIDQPIKFFEVFRNLKQRALQCI